MIDEKKLIENQPTVDAIEVVRCGKCIGLSWLLFLSKALSDGHPEHGHGACVRPTCQKPFIL